VSERYIILLFSPLYMDGDALRKGRSFGQAMRWRGDQATQVLVIEKDDFTKRQVHELPACMVFHFGNAWEADGIIRVDYAQSPDASVMLDWMPEVTAGDAAARPNHRAVPTLLTINTRTGKLSTQSRVENVEFPRVDPRYVARRNRYVYYAAADPATNNAGRLDGVMRLDLDSGRTDRHFMAGVRLEEHVFVPKPGGTREGQGYLVGVGFDVARQQSFATVFDAENIAAGPRCKAWLPYWLPHCFHGNFYSG
jgi:carotenoid cleavage dioxygenase